MHLLLLRVAHAVAVAPVPSYNIPSRRFRERSTVYVALFNQEAFT